MDALTLLGQVSYLNSFGFDRSAAQVYFCLPGSIGRALAGKNLAAGLFILVELLLVSAVCVVFRLPVTAASTSCRNHPLARRPLSFVPLALAFALGSTASQQLITDH